MHSEEVTTPTYVDVPPKKDADNKRFGALVFAFIHIALSTFKTDLRRTVILAPFRGSGRAP